MQNYHKNFNNLTKEQLISHIIQLENDFKIFSSQSTQVEDLLQQQLETCVNQLKEKDLNINEMQNKISDLNNMKSKVTSIETNNDLLESTIRTLKSQLESEIERNNECLEKISFLEHELELFKSALMNNENSIKVNNENINNYILDGNDNTIMTNNNNNKNNKKNTYTNLRNDRFSNKTTDIDQSYIEDWHNKETLEIQKEKLCKQLAELKKSKDELEKQLLKYKKLSLNNNNNNNNNNGDTEIKLLIHRQKELISLLKKSDHDKKVLEHKLDILQKKYSKIHMISKIVKLRKIGLASAYKTPALDSII